MEELNYLEKMWAVRTRRSERLIVKDATADVLVSSFDSNWMFPVVGAFREALDIKYMKRIKDKKGVFVWTQGPILKFKEGDLLANEAGSLAVQVYYAAPMGWDHELGSMYEGAVTFDVFSISDGSYTKEDRHSVTQMQFFEMLISGKVEVGGEMITLESTHQ